MATASPKKPKYVGIHGRVTAEDRTYLRVVAAERGMTLEGLLRSVLGEWIRKDGKRKGAN